MTTEKLLQHLRELSEEGFVSIIARGYLKAAIKKIEQMSSKISELQAQLIVARAALTMLELAAPE